MLGKNGVLNDCRRVRGRKVTPEGLPSYKIPPPLLYLPVSEAEPVANANAPDASNDDDEDQNEVLEDDMEQPENEGSEWVDDENDRSCDDELCGRKLKALYQNGRFTGVIEYYNTDINQYRVVYSDESKDYIANIIGIEDIDGIEIILID